MNQNTNTSVPPNDTQNVLRSYVYHQAHGIQRLQTQLAPGASARGFKTVLSVLFEIVLYLMFIAAIVLIVLIPSDPLSFSAPIDNSTDFTAGIHSDEIAAMMFVVKLLIFILAIPLLICAIVLRRNRRKGSAIAEAYSEVTAMRKSFEQLVGQYRI